MEYLFRLIIAAVGTYALYKFSELLGRDPAMVIASFAMVKVIMVDLK